MKNVFFAVLFLSGSAFAQSLYDLQNIECRLVPVLDSNSLELAYYRIDCFDKTEESTDPLSIRQPKIQCYPGAIVSDVIRSLSDKSSTINNLKEDLRKAQEALSSFQNKQ